MLRLGGGERCFAGFSGPKPEPKLSTAWPISRSPDWDERVNQALTDTELQAVRTSPQRGSPFGEASWIESTAKRLNLESSLRPRGRPASILLPKPKTMSPDPFDSAPGEIMNAENRADGFLNWIVATMERTRIVGTNLGTKIAVALQANVEFNSRESHLRTTANTLRSTLSKLSAFWAPALAIWINWLANRSIDKATSEALVPSSNFEEEGLQTSLKSTTFI